MKNLSVAIVALLTSTGMTVCRADAKGLSCDEMASVEIEGVTITGATLVPASAQAPETCRVTASIPPQSEGAYPINLAVVLPTKWNGKAIQGGNGGFAGFVAVASAPNWSTPESAAAFAFKGYALYGDDTGHPASVGASFALNEEALRNYGYASIKKTKDAAFNIIERRYGTHPRKNYFIGFSTGGRQALEAAERYPHDYDAVVSGDPVQNLSLQFISHYQSVRPFRGAGYLNDAELRLLGNYVLSVCDPLDGLEDGRIANSLECKPDISPLRCPNGADIGDWCLSDAQIAAVNESRSSVTVPYKLANGLRSVGGKPWGGELIGDGTAYRFSYIPAPGTGGTILTVFLADPYVKFFLAQDANYNADLFDWINNPFEKRMQEVSKIIDSTSTNLEDFRARGGKLILYAGGASEVPPDETVHYYKRLVSKMGKAKVDSFVRFYIFPNATHGGATLPGTPRAADLMSAIENWVDDGKAPGDLINSTPSSTTVTGEWPLCRYPTYPKYIVGDPMKSTSYRCAAPRKSDDDDGDGD